jgi:hypothetical protein
MKQVGLIDIVDETVESLLRAAEDFLEEISPQLEVVKNPEKLIGKPYELWDTFDFQLLAEVYGQEEPNPLSNLILDKEYEKVKALEAEEA